MAELLVGVSDACCFSQFPTAIFLWFTVPVSTSLISHFGHTPGLSETTSACSAMGQVYNFAGNGPLALAGVFVAGAGFGWTITGMSVMPHRGHLPGLSARTSLCSGMGQV